MARSATTLWMSLLAGGVGAMASGVAAGAADRPASAPPTSVAGDQAADIDVLVEGLSSDDFRTRDEATVRLSKEPSIRLQDIEQILKTRELPLEARARLMSVARERFALSPRAAMGVQFDLTTLRDRIVIERTFPNFHCDEVLEPGDIIVEAGGVPLDGRTGRPTIQGMIISREPGETLDVVVRRGKEKLRFDVRLGHFRDLDNPTLDTARLNRAWKARSAEYAKFGEPIGTPLHGDAWQSFAVTQQFQVAQAKAAAHGPTMVVHAGGQARPSAYGDASYYAMQARAAANRQNPMANAQAMQIAFDPNDVGLGLPPMTFAEEVDRLTQRKNMLDEQLKSVVRMAERVEPGSAEASLIESRVTRMQASVRSVEKQLEAIVAERDEKTGAVPTPGT